MRYFKGYIFCFLIFFHTGVNAQITEAPFNQTRLLFLTAEKALTKGDEQTYTLIEPKLKDYPLIPYLEYKIIVKAIKQSSADPKKGVPLAELQKFKLKYLDVPLWNSILFRWLKVEAKHGRWENFLNGYVVRDRDFYNQDMACHYHYAKYALTKDKRTLEGGLDLWLVGKSQPNACDELFGTMIKQQVIKPHHIVQRFYLSIEEKKYDLAAYLIKLMPKHQHNELNLWLSLAKKPQDLDNTHNLKNIKKAKYREKMLQSLFYRLARKNAITAKEVFTKLETKLNLSRDTHSEIVQDIAIRLAHEKDKDAIAWLERIPNAYLNPVAQEWRVRLGLKNQDWQYVLKSIEALDPLQANKPIWLYWKARAQLIKGQHHSGLKILRDLSQKRNYYGFLASEHLKKPHPLLHKPVSIKEDTWRTKTAQRSIERITELMNLHRITQAKREWVYLLGYLEEPEKLKAAQYAKEQGWHDLAIFSMSRTDFKDDLTIRFPLGFQDAISKHAKQNKLDPAWIFALTRQESAFAQKARSPVGAAGLMQLMPATAKYVAKKNHLPKPSVNALLTPETNIKLGTIYLGALNQSLQGQVVLATASYNAGINRILRWLPKEPVDSDVWIENIPYLETRNYVKNVLTYMGIYKNLLGEEFRLSSVMHPVKQFEQPVRTP